MLVPTACLSVHLLTGMKRHQKTTPGSFANMDVNVLGKNPIREVSVLQRLTESGPHPNVIDVIEVG